MDRYLKIKEKVVKCAKEDPALRAVVAIGSSTRSDRPADEYSDLDLIIATEEPEKWFSGAYPREFGKVLVSFIEPTLGGGKERRNLYEDALDVDFIIMTPEQFQGMVDLGYASEVMNRGYKVLYDDMGIFAQLPEKVSMEKHPTRLSEEEYLNTVNDFYFHIVWSAKKILRGELWTSAMCIDGYLKGHLLKILEFNCGFDGTDTWHNGRFLEKWAGDANMLLIPEVFACYDPADQFRALQKTLDLFSLNAREVAGKVAFPYPIEAEKAAREYLQKKF